MEVGENPLLLLRRRRTESFRERGEASHRQQWPTAGCIHPVDEVLHFGLQPPPPELDRHQLVRTHVRAVRLQLVLRGETAVTGKKTRAGSVGGMGGVPSTQDRADLCPSCSTGKEPDPPLVCSPEEGKGREVQPLFCFFNWTKMQNHM